MALPQVSTLTRLAGFDSAGEAFVWNDRVYRGIYSSKASLYRDVLQICRSHDLFRAGIVETWEESESPVPTIPYELILGHERIPFISYPHEWSASMLKDAALLHIDLFLKLRPYGLILKDWHPFNILFKSTTPIFVDFASIIPTGELVDEEYLTPSNTRRAFHWVWDKHAAYLYEMHELMFVPYFLLPLALMHQGRHSLARTRMWDTVLNARKSVMTRSEVLGDRTVLRWRHGLEETRKKLALAWRSQGKEFFGRVRSQLEDLKVACQSSDYADYYESKGEAFGFQLSVDWTTKQTVVSDVLQTLRPKTVLDLACNTGWFSILAAKNGCEVIACDIDEACIDKLYAVAKSEQLSILPLVMDVTRPTEALMPVEYEAVPKHALMNKQGPLIHSAEDRLKCDLVMALAIVHHLALGRGISLCDIATLLAGFTKHCLLVEFVPVDDPLVVASPDFFPAFQGNPMRFESYSIVEFTKQLSRHFSRICVKVSHPQQRSIVICER